MKKIQVTIGLPLLQILSYTFNFSKVLKIIEGDIKRNTLQEISTKPFCDVIKMTTIKVTAKNGSNLVDKHDTYCSRVH